MSNLRAFGTIISGNRQSKQEINPETRAAIISAVTAGEKKVHVAARFHVSPSAVTRVLQRFEASGNINSSPRSGRPKSLSEREKRTIIRKVRLEPRITHKELLADLGLPVSLSTIQRSLKEENLIKWKAKKRIHLSVEAAADRLSWVHNWSDREDELMQVWLIESGPLIYANWQHKGYIF